MTHEETIAWEASKNGVTIYARLMDFALGEPRHAIYKQIEKQIQGFTGDLAEELVEQLRQAYIAGVADGYREAVKQEAES